MVAGSEGDSPGMIARQAAASLAMLLDPSGLDPGSGDAGSPAALLVSCRRLLDRHPTCGPLWWLAARLLTAADPCAEAMSAADELDEDPTARALAADLPEAAVVTVVGWPELAGDALGRRFDVRPLVVDEGGEGALLVSRLERAGIDATLVPERGVAAAAARSNVVLLEASALGPEGFFAPPSSWAASAVARDEGRPVWLVAGVGRVLTTALWEAACDRVGTPDLWDPGDDLVPLRLVDRVVGPSGPETVSAALARADSPSVPELARRGLTPGSERTG